MESSSKRRETQESVKLAMQSKENCLAHFQSVMIQCKILSDARFPSWSTFTAFFGTEMDHLTFQTKLQENIVQQEKKIEQRSDCMVEFRAFKTQFKWFMTMDFKASLIHYKYESNIWRENITSMEVEAFRDQLAS